MEQDRVPLSHSPRALIGGTNRSLRRSSGGKPPHRSVHVVAAALESPVHTGSNVILLHRADTLRICYHFTAKYLYVGSYDVELVEQALQ
jgi:hypothetical protein